MAGLMSEHLSPVMEGFENPTMATVFREMLKVTPVKRSNGRGPKTAVGATVSGSCPSSNTQPAAGTASPSFGSSASEKIAFLKSIINEQRATADSLMDSAKKMGPVSQKLVAQKHAYDAAFESDLLAPMPNTSGSLQGFTLVFFTLAFFSLAIVASILTNQASGSVSSAVKIFGGFVIAYVISLSLISKYG
jgi:hypothetical protein